MTCLLILMRSSTLIDARQMWPPSAMVPHTGGGDENKDIAAHETRQAAPMSSTARNRSRRQCRRRAPRGAHVPANSGVGRLPARQGRRLGKGKDRSPRDALQPSQRVVKGGGSRGAGRRRPTPTPTAAPTHRQPPSRLHARRPANARGRAAGRGWRRGEPGIQTTHDKRKSKVGSPPPPHLHFQSGEERLHKTARRRRRTSTVERRRGSTARRPHAQRPRPSPRAPPPRAAETDVHGRTPPGSMAAAGTVDAVGTPSLRAAVRRATGVWSRRVWPEGHTPPPRRPCVYGR